MTRLKVLNILITINSIEVIKELNRDRITEFKAASYILPVTKECIPNNNT